MLVPTISLPALLRIKPGSLGRLGIYLKRDEYRRVVLLVSRGLIESIWSQVERALAEAEITILLREEVETATAEAALELLARIPGESQVIVGLGGGKALDVAKFVAFLAGKPYIAVPTSLSNDGFCSPQSSLTLAGKRKSLGARLPYGVVIDTEVCLHAPRSLWLSGVGDLVAKLTAVFEWRVAFHVRGELINDLAALLSDATVHQFLARPTYDIEGMKPLATALMLNGIAMEICGSSRPASGSEHLISHALDQISERPRLHGLQVGIATYLMARLQENNVEVIGELLETTGFWKEIRRDPFVLTEWRAAIELAPGIKPQYFSMLADAEARERLMAFILSDVRLRDCFV